MLSVLQRGPKSRKPEGRSKLVPDYPNGMQFHTIYSFCCSQHNFAYPGKK